MRDDTARILAFAAELAGAGSSLNEEAREARLGAFLAEYRTWVLMERGLADARADWAERHSILLHLMIGGLTLGEAMAILSRFAEPIWGASTRHSLIDEGRTLALFLDEPAGQGAEGLVSALWLLSSMTCQLEFLVGQRLDQLTGQVRGDRCIPMAAETFLFGRPLEYGAQKAAIRVPKIDAHRPLIATAAQIPAFLSGYMRLTVNSRPAYGIAQAVADLIARRLRNEPRLDCEMADIARELGFSVSTLRRRLEKEGFTFLSIRAETQDRLIKQWMRDTDWTVERIADRIGYSDAFALRRAFARVNGCSPLAFRKRALLDHSS